MSLVSKYIESGVLELYVMGAASPEEAAEVERMAAAYPEVRQELEQISLAMERYARAQAVQPRATVKALLLATIDYLERMKRGELPSSPPVLTPNTRISDFNGWLSKPGAARPDDADGIFARIIGYTPSATTAIVWVQDSTEQEVHHDEHERFLILEGACQIRLGEEIHALASGDYFEIPLHVPHQLKVTSQGPCKAILQRLSIG